VSRSRTKINGSDPIMWLFYDSDGYDLGKLELMIK
jgi:hypothetical protein